GSPRKLVPLGEDGLVSFFVKSGRLKHRNSLQGVVASRSAGNVLNETLQICKPIGRGRRFLVRRDDASRLQYHVLRIGAPDVDALKESPVELSAFETGTVQLDSGQLRPLKLCPAKIGAVELDPFQINSLQICVLQPGALQRREPQHGYSSEVR